MDTIIKLPVIAILLMCFTLANSQNTQFYKYKIEYWNKKGQNGKIMAIVGAPLAIAGGTLMLIGAHIESDAEKYHNTGDDVTGDRLDTKGASYSLGGFTLGVAGLGISVPGIINWSISKRKANEYQIKLDGTKTGFYFSPDQISLKLAFKF